MNGSYEGLRLGSSVTHRSTSVSHSQAHFPSCLTFTHGSTTTSGINWYKMVIDVKQLNSSTDAYSKFNNPFPIGGQILSCSFGIIYNTSYTWYYSFSLDPTRNYCIEATSMRNSSGSINSAPTSGLRDISNTVVADNQANTYLTWNPTTLILTYYDIYGDNSVFAESVETYTNHRLCEFDCTWYQMIT